MPDCGFCGARNSIERDVCLVCGDGQKVLTDLERKAIRDRKRAKKKRETCQHRKAIRVPAGPHAGRERVQCPSCGLDVTEDVGA